MLHPQAIDVDSQMSYVEKPIVVVDRQVRKLRSKEIPSVKVIWNHYGENEATWELEEDMRRSYPQLFQKGMLSCLKIRGRIFLRGKNCKTLVFVKSYMASKVEV